MAECIICQIIEGKVPSKKVYEDEEVMAFLDYNGAAPGHTFVVPKQHFPIFEQVPDRTAGKIFVAANKISSALFEVLGVQGTNIFIANGISAGQSVAHLVVNVIPRKENDGINLQWQPKQLSEEEMSTVELRLKEMSSSIAVEKEDDEKVQLQEEKTESMELNEDNYLWKSVNRKIA